MVDQFREAFLDSVFDGGLFHFGVPQGTWPEDSDEEEDED